MQKAEDLTMNVDYLENWSRKFIQEKYGRKRRLVCTQVSFSGLQFFFLYGLSTLLMTPKDKKRINKALSKQSKQLLLFYFLV